MQLDDIQDLNEAKMIIDMKNDEISSFKNSIKMVEIKTNKAIAEANYKINTEKNKVESLKKQIERHKLELTKGKQQLQKCEQVNKQNESKNHQLVKDLQQKIKHQKDLAKNIGTQLREHQISLQQVRQQIVIYKKQLKTYKRIVNIPKILEITGQSVAQDIPTYTDLMTILKDQSVQLQNVQDQLSKVTQQTIGEITVRERKISRFQKQLKQLHQQNTTLSSELNTVVQVIQQKQLELIQHKQMLDKQKNDKELTLDELNQQLMSLRSSMKYYQTQTLNKENKQQQALDFLHQITEQFEEKAQQYQKQIKQLTQLYQSYKYQHQQIQIQLKHQLKQLKLSNSQQHQQIQSLIEEIKSKQLMLVSIENQTSIFQKHMQQMGLEIQRWRMQAQEAVKLKNQLKITFKNKEQKFIQRQSELMDQIIELKRSASDLKQFRFKEEEQSCYRNLTSELQPQVNWEQICRQDLKNHNMLLNKLITMLSN